MVMSKADKIISKVPGGALLNQKIERNAKVIGINQDIKKQMAGFNSSGANNSGGRPKPTSNNSSGEKNRNGQVSPDGVTKKETGNNQKQGDNKSNTNNDQSRNEIDNLKKDIERYKKEIQQWEPEMKKKEEILKGHDDLAYHMIDSAREKGDENRARELSGMHQKGRAVMADQVISLSRQISRNKDIIFSMNNKLMNLERNNGPKR